MTLKKLIFLGTVLLTPIMSFASSITYNSGLYNTAIVCYSFGGQPLASFLVPQTITLDTQNKTIVGRSHSTGGNLSDSSFSKNFSLTNPGTIDGYSTQPVAGTVTGKVTANKTSQAITINFATPYFNDTACRLVPSTHSITYIKN
ncbi:MAG: hypothetical protein K0U12_07305 [Gammaproteobacteria bacterium]|nr:hypothetical protein [Gammaproteobacteria bacterium]